jgi:hypothetical protein
MRIPTIDNFAEENICQILAMLQRRIVAKYWASWRVVFVPKSLGGEYQIRGRQVSWWPGWGLRGPSRSLKCRRAEGAAGLGDREADLKRERLKDTDIMSSESIEITGT